MLYLKLRRRKMLRRMTSVLSEIALSLLNVIRTKVIEQYPAPVAGVRVIRFIVICAIGYVCAFCFVLLLRGGV
jgi:hypothetical protein